MPPSILNLTPSEDAFSPRALEGKKYFADTSKHPYEGRGGAHTFSGAYQISLTTWQALVEKYDMQKSFTPAVQDRYAVTLIENRKMLGYVRKNQIKEAVRGLTNEWASLPGGVDARKDKQKGYTYTIDDLLATYEQNLAELM